jgi:small subunit ribosomal protein S1
MGRERGGDRGDGPPPMDEGWWTAVLGEEEAQAPPLRPRTIEAGPDRVNCPGSAEDWTWARQLYDSDDTVELLAIGYNRGGLLVQARGLRGFVPVSHLLDLPPANEGADRSDQLAKLVGSNLCLKVIEFDPERGRLVLSQRAAQAGPGCRAALLNRLSPGDRVRGTVTNITRFGVFVELGGVEGLIHVSELSWGRVRHPADAVTCGQELEIMVLSVDREQARVALSLKELLPDPWLTVEERYRVGEIVEGVVTNVVRFGAFVGLEQGLEGLIHVSEFGDGSSLHERNLVREGEPVRARIVHIDGVERRLGLSLRLGGSPDAGSLESPDATPVREDVASH